MKNEKLRRLVTCALLLAVSAVLSIFPKFKYLANGGSITFCSMLPIIVASYMYGIRAGLLTGFAFSLIQLITGFSGSGLGPVAFVVELLFDYVVAFTVLGLGGMFRKWENERSALAAGAFTGGASIELSADAPMKEPYLQQKVNPYCEKRQYPLRHNHSNCHKSYGPR